MSQNDKVLQHLKLRKTITAATAIKYYDIYRLAARCFDLKQKGHNIITHRINRNGKHFALYELRNRKDMPGFEGTKAGLDKLTIGGSK